jgi:PKD repeat protein
MKHFTKIWLLQVLWLFMSFHTMAVPKDFSGKDPSYVSLKELYESAGNLHVNAPPPPISGNVSVCEGGVATYTYPSTPGYVYTWNVTNGIGTPAGNTFSVTWGNPGAGTVTLIVKNASGVVVDTQVLPVTVHSNPYPYITASFSPTCKEPKGERPPQKDTAECFQACDSSTVTYTAPLNPGSTYSWTVIGAISYVPSGNTVTVTWAGPGTGLISVTETSMYGCSNTFVKCVKIIESPDALFYTIPAAVGGVITICDGQTVQFFDASTGSIASPLMDWFWDFGDGTTSTDKNPTHTFYAGSYDVKMVVANECNCQDGYSVRVDVRSDPVPVIECISTVCANGIDDYHVDASKYGCPGAIYNWTVTGGVITSPMPYGPDIQVQWGASGPGIVSLEIIGCGGCPGTASVVVSIISPTTTITGPNPACQFSNAIYSIPNMSGSIYTWTVTGGWIVSGQGTEQVEVNWFGGTVGTVSVTYNNPSLNCSGSATLNVNLRPQFAITGPNIICRGGTGNYVATAGTPSQNAAYQWQVTNSSNVLVASFSGSNMYSIPWTFVPGIYKITVVNNSGGFCNSPQSYFVTVSAAPPPPTFISGPRPVCPGQSYMYTSASNIPGTFIEWTVINGSPANASGNNLTVTWGPSGPYVLQARQVSMTYPYCPSTPFIDTIPVKVPPPGGYAINGPTPVCKNTVQNYSANSSIGDEYTWSISPATYGSIISGQGTAGISIQWNNTPGVATITMSVRTCSTISNVTRNITITNPPNPVINAPDSICEDVPATFSTPTSGTAFSWNFGDGTPVVAGPGPLNHVFANPGTYNVTLTVTNPNGCPGQTNVVRLINVKVAPDASISTGDPNAFCPGSPISTTMYVTSLVQPGSTITWWRNGATFVGSGPSYTATIPGAYTAVVTNVQGCSTRSNIINVIQLSSCTPCPIDPHTLSFTATKTGCLTYNFNATISGNGRIVSWSFDDPYSPGSSTSLTPSHTYSEPGFYRVVVRGRFPKTGVPGDSCDTERSQTIVVPIKAKFNYEISCGGPGTYNLRFNDLSTYVGTHVINSWSWTFPGGSPSTSTAQNPSGIAFAPGTYNVTLTITSVTGYTCTITLPVTVPPFPSVSILGPDSSCQGNPVNFSTTTPGVPVNGWLWNFGDGASSALNPTIRTYNAPTVGNTLVTLTITDQFGCPRVFTKNIFIHQNTVVPTVSAAGSTTFCAGQSVVLNSSVSGAQPPVSYLWSTVDVTPSIVATQTGGYYVEVRDGRGCRAKSNTVNVLVHPVPNAKIVGRDEYCAGQTVLLSGYQGNTYTYQWLVNGSPSMTGPTFSQILTVGTHNIRIIITNTLNGCKDTSPVYPVIVRPLPPPPGIGVSPTPACEGNPITLTGFPTVSPYTFTWSTGSSSNSIVVWNANIYTLTITDQFGCQSKTSTQVYDQPDFTNLMTGCYEFCDTGDVTMVGPVGPGYTYQWYYNGSPIPGPNGTNKDLIIPVGQDGIYNLEIVTYAGCKDMSADIEVRFIHCRDCKREFFFREITCVIDTNGTQVYYFTMFIDNPFGPGTTYSLSSPGGPISGLSPVTLAPGMNLISGFFADVPPVSNPFCVTGALYFREERCLLKEICVDLPHCEKPQPCKVDTKWLEILCAGRDANGNPQYYFNYEIGWPGSDGSTILSITTPYGTITNPSINTLNNGLNNLSGIFTDLAGKHVFCFEMYVFDPERRQVCFIKDCIELPDCPEDIGPCGRRVFSLKDIRCGRRDINGNPTYRVHFTVNNPFPGGASIYFTSPDGGISNVSPNIIGPGSNGIDALFTDLAPYTSTVCVTIIIVDHESLKTCTQRICFTLPECSDAAAGEAFTGIGAKDSDLEVSGNNIQVNPNPAKEQTVISYTFGKGTARSITVTDMYGRTLRVFNVTDDKGQITLETSSYSPGVYMVTGYADNKSIGSKRLIIIK